MEVWALLLLSPVSRPFFGTKPQKAPIMSYQKGGRGVQSSWNQLFKRDEAVFVFHAMAKINVTSLLKKLPKLYQADWKLKQRELWTYSEWIFAALLGFNGFNRFGYSLNGFAPYKEISGEMLYLKAKVIWALLYSAQKDQKRD